MLISSKELATSSLARANPVLSCASLKFQHVGKFSSWVCFFTLCRYYLISLSLHGCLLEIAVGRNLNVNCITWASIVIFYYFIFLWSEFCHYRFNWLNSLTRYDRDHVSWKFNNLICKVVLHAARADYLQLIEDTS